MKEETKLCSMHTRKLLNVLENAYNTKNEIRIYFDKESGIEIVEMDPTTVSLIQCRIEKEDTIAYNQEDNFEIAINPEEMIKVLRQNKKTISTLRILKDKDEYTHIRLSTQPNGLKIDFPLIDLSNQEKTKIPNTEDDTKIKVHTKELKDAIKSLTPLSDALIFNTSQEGLKIKAISNITSGEIKVKIANQQDEIKKSQSKYDIKYLNKILKKTISNDIYIRYSKDKPITFIQKDQLITVKHMLAPRIEMD